MVWNEVEGFNPYKELICYRKQRKLPDGSVVNEDTLYMPAKAQHEWFLRCHPDGSVLTEVSDNGVHAMVRATVSYDGHNVTDAYADGWKTTDGNKTINFDYVSKASKLAKRYALSFAGFGMPKDAAVTDDMPIIIIDDEAKIPDDSQGITMSVNVLPPMPAAVPAPVSTSVPKAELGPFTPIPAPIPKTEETNEQEKEKAASIPAAPVPVPPVPIMVEDEKAEKEPEDSAKVATVEEASPVIQEPAATDEAKAADKQEEKVEPSEKEMTYEEALKCIIPTGKYKGMTLDAARRMDGNEKTIKTYVKKWYRGKDIGKAASIVAKVEHLDYTEL